MLHALNERARHLPGEAGVWVFILGDLLIFAALFITFAYYRSNDVASFIESQHALNQRCGALNTIFMLTSSWCVAIAVQVARVGKTRAARRWLVGGMACAVCFVVVKIFEYQEKIAAGITLTSNDFFMYYYMLTGLHLMHVLLGLGVLIFLWRSLYAPVSHTSVRTLESGACFWHMVDLLWIVLFALLYMLR